MWQRIEQKINNSGRTKWAVLFLAALMIYEISAGFEMTMLGTSSLYLKIGDILKIVSIALLLIGAIVHIKYYSISQWITLGLLGILSAICTYTTKSAAPVLAFAFWVNMADVHLDDILKVYFVVLAVVFVFAILMLVFGYFSDVVLEGDDHCIGFTHSNTAAATQLCIILTYMTIRNNRLRWYEWLLMCIFTGVVFWLTGSKCMVIASAIAIILGIVLNSFKNEIVNKAIGILAIIAYPVFFVISYASGVLYSEEIRTLTKLNEVLNGRLELGASGIKSMGVTLLGHQITWSGGDVLSKSGEIIPYNIVDSSYLSILISYGWIYAIVLMLIYISFAVYAYKTRKWNWSLLVLVVLICGLAEGTIITIVCNPALIAIGTVFFTKYSTKKSEEAK